MAFGSEEIGVPDTEQGEDHRHVAPRRRAAEMLVHGPGACQHPVEVVETEADGDAQPDSGPQRIAPADPFAELQKLAPGNTRPQRPFWRGGDADKMRRGKGIGETKPVAEPFGGGIGVEQGFLRGKGFARNNDQGGFRVEIIQGRTDGFTINIAEETAADLVVSEFLERLAGEFRSEVGAADAEI